MFNGPLLSGSLFYTPFQVYKVRGLTATFWPPICRTVKNGSNLKARHGVVKKNCAFWSFHAALFLCYILVKVFHEKNIYNKKNIIIFFKKIINYILTSSLN